MEQSNRNSDDFTEQCRKSIRRLSIGSSVISDGKTIYEERNQILDIEEGPELGKGSYSNVREVRRFHSQRSLSISHSTASVSERSLQSASTVFDPNTDPESRSYYYAVKKVRQDLTGSGRKHAAIDLAVEAQFLTSLSHQHIVSIEGVGDEPGSKNFFIIIERLDRTLTEQIQMWKVDTHRITRTMDGSKVKLTLASRMSMRIGYAKDLSCALAYLHEKKMIFRDLKPENVGFTHDNEIKIFDFGLARELREERKVGRDKYLLSLAGTRRYMAPEVMKGSPYGLPVDVFSFSLLLWEMLHMEKPYRNLDAKQHERALVLWRSRPKVSSEVPRAVKSIILKGWNNDAKSRPRMDIVLEKLQLHLESIP